MDIIERNVAVTMCRADLADIPHHPLPTGFTIRPYAPGDDRTWVDIQSAADRYNTITLDLHHREFGTDIALLSQRQFFMVDAHRQPLGTASAWFDDRQPGPPQGRVHWVAIHPDHQGRHLAKPLLAHICHTLRSLGHSKTYLNTSTARLPAIHLYLAFGFTPKITTPAAAAAWNQLKPHIPALAAFGPLSLPARGQG